MVHFTHDGKAERDLRFTPNVIVVDSLNPELEQFLFFGLCFCDWRFSDTLDIAIPLYYDGFSNVYEKVVGGGLRIFMFDIPMPPRPVYP